VFLLNPPEVQLSMVHWSCCRWSASKKYYYSLCLHIHIQNTSPQSW